MKNKGWSARGFTIIEVVLVLAIAGLIFLIIFLAVPAVQRSVRDTQRRNDLAEFAAAIQEWKANNRNQNIDTDEELQDIGSRYFFDHKDPSTGEPYRFYFIHGGSQHQKVVEEVGQIDYSMAHICGSDTTEPTFVTSAAPPYTHNIRYFAVTLTLETGNHVFCIDNH